MSKPSSRSRQDVAADAWGPQIPDWIAALAKAVDLSSQNQVARRLGISAAAISQALRKSYPSPLDNIEALVRDALMQDGVACPELGRISDADCARWVAKSETYLGTSRLGALMARACRACPLNPQEPSED